MRSWVKAVMKKYPAILRGDEVSINCLFCEDRGEPSPDTKKRLGLNYVKGVGNCFRCGYAGPIQKILRDLGIKHTDTLDDRNPRDLLVPKVKLNPEFPPMEPVNIDSPKTILEKRILIYLRQRGLTNFQLKNLRPYFSLKIPERVILPVFFKGELVYYQARYLGRNEAKYLNPKMDVSHLLYNWETVQQYETIIVSEGILDSNAIGQNATCGFGKSLSKHQLKMLAGSGKDVLFFYDADANRTARKNCIQLSRLTSKRVGRVLIDQGDPLENISRIPQLLRSAIWGMRAYA